MARLTPEQQKALDDVTAAHRRRVTVRADAEAKVRAAIEEEVHAAELIESRAVRKAVAAGVPRTRIGKIGLATSDYATVAKVLALTDAEAQAEADALDAVVSMQAEHIRTGRPSETQRFADQLHARDLLLRIEWPEYVAEPGGHLATLLGTTEVPLRGFIHRDPEYPEWVVLEDDEANVYPAKASGPLQDAIDTEAAVQAAIERAAASL